MCHAINNPASYKFALLYSFFIRAAEIHLELHVVYGQIVMNEGTIRQCSRMCKGGR
jgi:hypothetical protein